MRRFVAKRHMHQHRRPFKGLPTFRSEPRRPMWSTLDNVCDFTSSPEKQAALGTVRSINICPPRIHQHPPQDRANISAYQ